jgi:transcriptional regulator with XRE-family HTH domain
MSAEFFICSDISPGMLAKLERIRRGLRQVDVAEAAGVTQGEISALERGQYVIPAARRRIFRVLELDTREGPEAE